MICHNKRILKKRAAEKADQEMICVTEYAFPFFVIALFMAVSLLGYVFWDFYESRQAYKLNSQHLEDCLNGKIIMAEDIEFRCHFKKIEFVNGLK